MTPQDLVGKNVRFRFGTARAEERGIVRCIIPRDADAADVLAQARIKHPTKNKLYNKVADRLAVEVVRDQRKLVRLVPFAEGRFEIVGESVVEAKK